MAAAMVAAGFRAPEAAPRPQPAAAPSPWANAAPPRDPVDVPAEAAPAPSEALTANGLPPWAGAARSAVSAAPESPADTTPPPPRPTTPPTARANRSRN